MSLIELRRSHEVTKREQQTGQNTKRDDPDFLDYGMPELPKIKPAHWLCKFGRQIRRCRAIGLRPSGGYRCRSWRIDHKEIFGPNGILHARMTLGKARSQKFSLKNAFPDGDGIARLDEKTSAAPLCEPLRVDFKKLIAPCRGMSSYGHSFWGGDARVASCHGDRFQEIDATGASIRHFITTRP